MTASASRAARVSVVAAVLLVLTACTTTIRQHEDFATRRTSIRRVAIVPPQVDATLVVFKGTNEALPEEIAKVSAALPDLLKRTLEEQGFTVAPPVTEESLDPELRSMLGQLRRTANQVGADMYKTAAMRTSDAMKYRASVGPQVADLASALDADALLLVDYSEFHKSGGQTARDITVAVLLAAATVGNVVMLPPRYGATLRVILVDGTTGEMLWSNIIGRAEFVESEIDPLIGQIFLPMEQQSPPTLEAQREPEPDGTAVAPPSTSVPRPARTGEKSVEVTMESAPAEPEPPRPSERSPAASERAPVP